MTKEQIFSNCEIKIFDKNSLCIQNREKEASIKLNTTQSNICHCLRGRTKKHKGYEWEYKKTDIKS